MGGYFGATLKTQCIADVFFGTDYHSHLGTRRGGMAAYDGTIGLQRAIHNIENSPFRTKFENVFNEMKGTSAIGCISDSDPQPMLIRSHLGTYAICMVGIINNIPELLELCFERFGCHFDAMTGGNVNSVELAAALINSKTDFAEGLRYAQQMIKGTAAIVILRDDGSIIAARDFYGRLPMHIGKKEEGYCVSFESFAYRKLGYEDDGELGPGEISVLTPYSRTQLTAPQKEMRICSFLWSYYGYPTSDYEGVNVEAMRCRNGEIMADNDNELNGEIALDYVCGVPDSGTPHAIGYANRSHFPFARAFIKYTPTWPRSFLPSSQQERDRVAKMKQVPVRDFIDGKRLLFVDDSIVRGTQLRETVEFLYENGAKEVHMRSACPPIMYGCKFLNFTRATSDLELITRRVIIELEGEQGFDHLDEYSDPSSERGRKMRRAICEKFHFASLEFQSLEGIKKAIGIDGCKLCTYCWNGKE
ncbi:MAG: amidophosphoribosyltransferase [Clostridia bacterium]|nr:amidophosphoribosyltransferase [Clostridia bacterium]